MKQTLATLSLLLVAAGLFAISAKVIDADGQATAQMKSGKTEAVSIGRTYGTGDSIRTGKSGLVELSQEGLTIRMGPSTVFTLMEKELGGKPKGVLAVTLGTVKVKYAKLTGSEPLIQSVGCIAGVRGTELTVWAGTDGASQLIVDSGLVTVEAFGKTVELGPDEAVVVLNGQQPGDKFTVHREQIDHAKWDQGRIEALLADPLAALDGIHERLAYYASNVAEYAGRHREVSARLAAERENAVKVGKEKGKDAQQEYDREFVRPLVLEASSLVLNYRWAGLAALSMRRFVGGRMYLLLKVKYAANLDDPTWTGFVDRYSSFVADFESGIMPVLVDADF
ncbi:MAG: hypothetical protein NTU62_00515 [Spirochaetes bacterium]|nr:hypothetical protein [Spirochaetota bacterium]